MKILLSHSRRHYSPEEDKIIYHSAGIEARSFYQILQEFGEVRFIDSRENPEGGEYDLLVSLPLNFKTLSQKNKFKKRIAYLNVPEPNYLKNTLREEASRLGCKVRDCYAPIGHFDADHFLVLGGGFNRTHYLRRGIPDEKMTGIAYGMERIPFKERDRNKRPIFLHVATSLGLRKGVWWVVEDFKKANLDAELWLVGQLTNEKFWIDYIKEAEKDPRIKYFGWIDCNEPKYIEILQKADFFVFPSFGEGQSGTTSEAMTAGCLPIISEESGIPYFPLGKYVRGETKQWQDAYNLPNEEFKRIQLEMKELVKEKYNDHNFKETVRQVVKRLFQ